MFRELAGSTTAAPADGSAYAAGHAGLGVAGRQTDEFDNPRIAPVRQPAAAAATLTAAAAGWTVTAPMAAPP